MQDGDNVTIICRRIERDWEKQEEFHKERSESGKRGRRKQLGLSPGSSNGSARACQKSEVRSQKDTPPIVPQGTDKSEWQLKVERLLRRRVSTPWSEKELKVYRKNQQVIEATTSEDWEKLQAYYRQSPYARKDLATLLNNWNGEIDRAIRFKVEPEKPDEKRISAKEYVD